ncbi:MAG: UDP-4-amino-4,6-dideoxy-N-acetyl-beta-L-altrosamine N-acetyltransferase [Acinetobacter sp.]
MNNVNVMLENIIHLPNESLEALRNIRNESQIRKWMYTDHIITTEEHNAWIIKQRTCTTNINFLIRLNHEHTVGAVSVNNIDMERKKADWAFYLTRSVRTGLGAVIEFHILDYVFDQLQLEELNCEVLGGNVSVLSLHNKFGFTHNGLKKDKLVRNDNLFDIHLLSINKSTWHTTRSKITDKYFKLLQSHTLAVVL